MIMHIPNSPDKWIKLDNGFLFRIWDNKLYRKEINKAYYGGYQIKWISLLTNRGLKVASEWVNL